MCCAVLYKSTLSRQERIGKAPSSSVKMEKKVGGRLLSCVVMQGSACGTALRLE